MISLLCPTRGRPKQALNLYRSFINTQSNKNELIFCIQKEDSSCEEYVSIFKENSLKYYLTESMPTSYLWNQMAFNASGNLLTLIGDDVEIQTSGWDEKIENEAAKYKDNIFVITVEDGRSNETPQDKYMRCPHPTVHKRWVELLGYFVPPFFMHRYLDKYTQELAINIGRYIEIKNVVFKHLKKDFFDDATGKRSRNWINYDKYIYENVSRRYFSKDMEILKENISQDSK